MSDVPPGLVSSMLPHTDFNLPNGTKLYCPNGHHLVTATSHWDWSSLPEARTFTQDQNRTHYCRNSCAKGDFWHVLHPTVEWIAKQAVKR